MKEEIKKDYNSSINFWDSAFIIDEETKKQYTEFLASDSEAWKNLSNSPKLFEIITSNLSGKENILDYGCGEGWAGLGIKKCGGKNVTCVDVVPNAINFVKFLQSLLKINEGFNAECVTTTWLSEQKDETYDGIVTSNVLDVVPSEVSENIIKELSRIAKKGATVVIGLNHYMEPKANAEKKIEVKEGNMIYVNEVLRLVSHTDEEWTQIFNKYFTVEKLDHFAWDGEESEKRRVFILKK